jgi:phospholipase C
VRLGSLAAALALAACGASTVPAEKVTFPLSFDSTSSKIAHVVVIVQENRSFNNLFATFKGTAGTTIGKMRVGTGVHAHTVSVALTEKLLESRIDLNHTYSAYRTAYRDGNMDAFNQITMLLNGKPEGTAPYAYVNPSDIAPYWAIAQTYAIGDHLFQTQGGGSFIAHQDLIRGGTAVTSNESLVDDPTRAPWGCSAPHGTVTSLITTDLKYEPNAGPFPCTSDYPSPKSYTTLQDLLDQHGVSWKYYTPTWHNSNTGDEWNAFLSISSVYNDANEWKAHIAVPETNVLRDIASKHLPQLCWIIPDAPNSDHPGYHIDNGPSWVASIVNAIGESQYWNNTVIVVVWDDWGGFYDPLAPLKLDRQGGPGFRVPLLVVSPYVPKNEISHTVYGFGSIVRFIEDTWSLGRLGTTDGTSRSIADMLHLDQTPRAFVPIKSKYSRAHFLRERPSGQPIDTE